MMLTSFSSIGFLPTSPVRGNVFIHPASTHVSSQFLRSGNRATRSAPLSMVSSLPASSSTDESQKNGFAAVTENLRKLCTAVLVSAPLISAVLIVPPACHARGKQQSSITMTDQVPTFSLPSQSTPEPASNFPQSLIAPVRSIAKVVVLPVGIISLTLWSLSRLYQRAQQRKIRDFQTQLQSFSSLLDLDLDPSGVGGVAADNASSVKRNTASSASESSANNGNANVDLDASALEIFRNTLSSNTLPTSSSDVPVSSTSGASNTAPADPSARPYKDDLRTDSSVDPARSIAHDIEAETSFEQSVIDAMLTVASAASNDNVAKNAASSVTQSRDAMNLSNDEATMAAAAIASRILSARIDDAFAAFDRGDTDAVGALAILSDVMNAMRAVVHPLGATPTYTGLHTGSDGKAQGLREELYRRFAVYLFSREQGFSDEMRALDELQRILSVSDERAEAISVEIARGMFQVAASAAMADGGLSEDDRKSLERLKKSFGEALRESDAEAIMSEVAVMRSMYALQQLVQEQGVSEEDVKQLRNMCKELGVDIDEMVQNADALGEVLGPDAKNFVESLRGVLAGSAESDKMSK